MWERSFSEDTIKDELIAYLKSNESKINSIWSMEISDLQEKVQMEYGDLMLDKSKLIIPDADHLTVDATLGNTAETIGKTTFVSAVFGGAASAYAAGLGTYAAHLSMAGALGSFMPPVLAAGVLVGAVKRYFDVKSLQKKWKSHVEDAVEEIRRKIRRNVTNGYRGSLQKTNKFFCEEIEQKFLSSGFGLKKIDEVDERIQAIETHRENLETYMDNAPSYGDVIKSLQDRLNDLLNANKELKELAGEGQVFSAFEKMQDQMVMIKKEKKHLEQELDKKEKELVMKKEELEKEKQTSHLSQESIDQLKRKLEHNDRELERVEKNRKELAENYENSQRNLNELQKQCSQLKGALEQMQEKFSRFKASGFDLEAPDAMEKLETSMHEVTDSFIENEKNSFQKQMDVFQKQYPRYDKKTINDLATGELLRKQFHYFKETPSVDFSPALLPALVMLERVMRQYYVKKGYLHHKAADCPWANICNDVKDKEYCWRPGFGDELLGLKSVRNQAVHKGNIDYETYEDSYGKIVSDPDSVIRFIYDIVTVA